MKKGRRESKRKTDLDQYANLDSGDELGDGFAAGEYRIALQPGPAAAGDDEDSNEEAVYDLDDEDEDDEDSADDVDVLEAALLKGGKAAQLAKQARYLEQKLKLQQGELDDDDDDDDEQQEGDEQQELRDKLWGANKQAYYQTDDAEGGSDNEALAEEEAEVRRLQQQQIEALVNEDYGVTAQHPAERSLEQVVANGGAGAAGSRGVEVETVTKDLGALTAEEQVAVVMADAPELLSLLDELQACLTEVRGRIGPLLREVAGGGLATTAGLSYLEAKHLMLLQYCMCIVAYLMLKAEGKSVKDHPVIGRLVQLRAYIEKIRPIDKQLAYQIDKLLRATSVVQASSLSAAGDAGAEEDTAAEDALQYRPNPQRLITKAPLVGDAAGLEPTSTGVYRPPKLNPVAMDEDRALSNKEMRKLKEAQRRAKRSVVLRELAEELEGAPEEVREEVPGMDTAAAVAARHRLEARAAAEEELMLRVPLSKQEANKLRAERRAGLSGAGLADFADDVADIVAASSAADGAAGGSSMAQLYGKHRMSQRFGADLALQHKFRSGDEDLQVRKPLHVRRAEYDAVAAHRAMDLDEQPSGSRKRSIASSEDEFYASTKADRSAAKAAKKARQISQLAPPLPDPEATGQRKITDSIQRNRGLTPHRRKDLKNPRKKHRVKFAQAVVRRKGQVQGVKTAPGVQSGYSGEATGIKAKVAKSVRLD